MLNTLNKDDYVIVCGDFGIWNYSEEHKYWMNWFSNKNYTTLFWELSL